ncbi:NADP-dependent oxidoreductase domain-containing protein [Aspergillus varians]
MISRSFRSLARRSGGRISAGRNPTSCSHVPPNCVVISRAYSIALVGLGYRGFRSHFRNLVDDPSVSITAVCDTNRVALEAFSATHQGIPTYCSLPQLLQSHTPDFAIVSVPHSAHAQCITTLAAKGIAVLKEKPVAESIAEYEWMTSLPVRIGITFQKRFERHFLHFKSLLPLVGDVAAVEASLALNITNLEETWRAASGVGVTEDLGCHMLDMLMWLFGPPTSVMAHQVSSVRPGQRYGGDDVSDIIMDWGAKKCIGHVRLSRVAHRSVQSITVTGTNGTLHLDGYAITHHDSKGFETLNVMHQPREKQVIQTMAQEFGDWISGRRPEFSTSLANVLHTVSVVDAIKASLASRQVRYPLLLSSSARSLGAATNSRPLSRTSRSCRGFAANFSTSSSSASFAYPSYRERLFRLNTGALVPAVGLGTRRAERPGQIYKAVRAALDVGYRHIDTAQSSGNEHEIGRAIKDSGVPRRQIWITTKLDNRWHTRVDSALQLSLGALDMDYVDLYLMHWPVSACPNDRTTQLKNWNFVNTWEAMQQLQPHIARNIGVSNFGIVHLQQLLNHPSCKVVPAVNQIELHPYWPSRGLLTYCNNHDIHCTAYSCLGSTNSPLLQDQAVLEVSRMKDKSPQQILIKWAIQRGTSVVPKSVSASRIRDNLELDGWDLSGHEIDMLNGCSTRLKSCNDDWLPGKVFFGEDG